MSRANAPRSRRRSSPSSRARAAERDSTLDARRRENDGSPPGESCGDGGPLTPVICVPVNWSETVDAGDSDAWKGTSTNSAPPDPPLTSIVAACAAVSVRPSPTDSESTPGGSSGPGPPSLHATRATRVGTPTRQVRRNRDVRVVWLTSMELPTRLQLEPEVRTLVRTL